MLVACMLSSGCHTYNIHNIQQPLPNYCVWLNFLHNLHFIFGWDSSSVHPDESYCRFKYWSTDMGKQLENANFRQFQLNYRTRQCFLEPFTATVYATKGNYSPGKQLNHGYGTSKSPDLKIIFQTNPVWWEMFPTPPNHSEYSTSSPTSPPRGSCPCNKKCCMDDSGGRSFAESHLWPST